MKREDLLMQDVAKSKGWEIELHTLDIGEPVPQFPLTFKKGNCHLWKHKKKWICANYDANIPGNYMNPEIYESLELALGKH